MQERGSLSLARGVRRTSIETFHKIRDEGLLSKRRYEVYAALYEHGPATASDLVSKIPGGRWNPTQANLHARLGELRDLGVVQEMGTARCKFTGRKVIVWEVTSSLPVESSRGCKDKITCPACRGRGYFEQGNLFSKGAS